MRYTIHAAAERLGCDKQTLRRWEKRPDFPFQVRRDRMGARWYSEEDITQIRAWKWPERLGPNLAPKSAVVSNLNRKQST